MAGIAVAFHWSLTELSNMSLSEIMDWHQLALQYSGEENVKP